MTIGKYPLHDAAAAGDAHLLERLLAELGEGASAEIERLTPDGYTALMIAVMSPHADAAMVEKLIARGAAIHRGGGNVAELAADSLTLALRGGDVRKVAALARAGADLRRTGGYTSLLDGIHGRDVRHDPRLLELIQYLIDRKVDLDYESKYQETALRVLSNVGRFDAVRLLLDAGADESQLEWNPLIRAVAFGDAAGIETLLDAGADLEARDRWERTPWLVAITAGDIAIAERLRRAGADIQARGRCAKPPLFYAIHSHDLPMLRWLIEVGCDAGAVDQFGGNALMEAVERGFTDAIEPLIAAGLDVNAEGKPYTALASTQRADVALRLLELGADPAEINAEARRALVGLPRAENVRFLEDVTPEEFRRGAARRFGSRNAEQIHQPFWLAMIRAGVNAWAAAKAFPEVKTPKPVWCAQRFGQSISFLPDGRIIQVAGEHEDSYDPDFCIYNDVFVHHPDGRIQIFGYPREVFPPTDFHTATLAGRKVYLIGSLGYQGERRFGSTPVYSLDIDDLRIEGVETHGENPGWIYKHRARLSGEEILISGGTKAVEVDGEEDHVDNTQRFALSLKTLRWRALRD